MEEKENNKKRLQIRNSTAEFLIFQIENKDEGIEVLYKDETIWVTQKAMATLFDVSVPAINQHLKNIYEQGELQADATIKKNLIVQQEGNRQNWANRIDKFLDADERPLLTDAGRISAEQAKEYAESEFEKYRIIQDRLFQSDFDKFNKDNLFNFENDIK